MSKLALLGGKKAVTLEAGDMFKWPIVNPAMEKAIVDVLRAGSMSGLDLTREFERRYCDWMGGVKYGLGHNTGTAALHSAMFGVGLGAGDELICPSITYWASAAQALSLGASVVFADVDPDTLCLDPKDLVKRITPRTKAIMVVHYAGYPADMDAIMAIAKKHKISVIEDVSHAQGTLYKGRMVGTFGEAAGMSLMSGKSFAVGEAGILVTNSKEVYDRAVLFGHYERHGEIEDPKLAAQSGLPWGGYKYRMHQMSSAVALEQLKKYDDEIAVIDKAMNYFSDGLEGIPGVKARRPAKDSGMTMGGWYAPFIHYVGKELGGLSITRFCEALVAEGLAGAGAGVNKGLHTHPLFSDVDVYHHGRPTQALNLPPKAFKPQNKVSLPVSEGIQEKVIRIAWFKHFRKDYIDQCLDAYRKVAENYKTLLKDDPKKPVSGLWGANTPKAKKA